MSRFPHHYHFITEWEFQAGAAKIYDLIGETARYPEWWHGPALSVVEIRPGDKKGVGRVTRFELKGWLPCRLRWQLECEEALKPVRIAGVSSGDFVGRAVWQFRERGPSTHVTFDWEISAEAPFIKRFSFLLRPLFLLHHDWVMATWKKSLQEALRN